MQRKVLKKNKAIENALIFSIFLIFLDSYQIFQIPLSWIGSSLLLMVVSYLYFDEKITLNLVTFVIYLIAIMPTLVSLFYNQFDILY